MDQLIRVVGVVIVSVYIARRLGPEQFGILSYAISLSTFLITLGRLGMDAILVRELVGDSQARVRVMGTAFWLMLAAGGIGFLVMNGIVWLSDEEKTIKWYLTVISLSAFSPAFSVVDYFFQAEVKAKLSAICRISTLLLTSSLKLILVYMRADMIWIIWAHLLEFMLLGMILLFAKRLYDDLSFLTAFCRDEVAPLLRSAWPMVAGAISIQIYMRVDQVMIRSMLGLHEVGVYSAAVRVYEAWALVPVVVSVSLLPALALLKRGDPARYRHRFTQLFRLVIWPSVAIAALVSLLGDHLIEWVLGAAYRESYPVLVIVMWTAVFAAMGSVSARYFNIEKMEKKYAMRTFLTAGLNVCMNLLLLPLLGIRGAALATLVCTAFGNYMMDWFDPDLKELLAIKHEAIFGFNFSRRPHGN